ncbi:MAG: 2-dehydropantoate 2-reductase [Firmicutes bacterium]|nr:2-dehydropantoate 2-reductase [Bacillota bacterium]MDI6705091.1 2-dehydropantoate 2-reductase [Bacillota bacterium]
MKIAVLGAGAMGSLYGGLLSDGGNEVWLLDIWKEHVDAVNERGLVIEEEDGERLVKNIKAASNPEQIGSVDLLIVFVKSTVTGEAVRGAVPVIGEKTPVLTLQNGLGNIEKIEEVVGKGRVIGGVTSHGATMLGPGRIRHAGRGDTYLGEVDGSITPRLKTIAKAFNEAGIKSKISQSILSLIWGKLIVNVGINALAAITGLRNGMLPEYAGTSEILEMAVAEAVRVAETKGIKLQYDDPVAHVKEVCRLTAQNKASMLQDVLNKRKTEIDMINGAVVREGKTEGIATPVNKVLAGLVSVMQETYDIRIEH